MAKKKITRVGGDSPTPDSVTKKFVPTADSKGKVTQLRVFAALLWLFAVGAQVVAITLLFKQPLNMTWIIVLILIDLALAVTGSLLWKKSNRLDPASEQNKFLFFMQSQLGMVVAVIAFLPLIIFILTNKNIDAKQKGILGGFAGVALWFEAGPGLDLNPPWGEQSTEKGGRGEELTGGKRVYWANSGSKGLLMW